MRLNISRAVHRFVQLCLSVLILGLSACSGGGSSDKSFQSVQITPGTPSVALGTGQQFKATALFSDGSKEDVTSLVTWSSSDKTVATIGNAGDSIGLAQTLLVGTTTITANYPGGSGSTTLTVTAAIISSIAVTPDNQSVASGTSQQFKATATFSDKTTQDVTTTATWSSSNSAVATVSNASTSQGLAQTLGIGSSSISASFSGQIGSVTLNVTAATLSSIAVTPAAPSVAKGTKQQFTAIATFSDNTTQDVTQQVNWTSSNGKVATISNASGSQGLGQTLLVGSTTITASFNGKAGTTTLTVTAATVNSIGVTPTSPVIAKGTAEQFAATATFTDSTTQDVTQSATWTSSDTTVATISSASGSNGFAQSIGTGKTTISAAFGGQTGSTTLTVTGTTVSSISLTPANPSVSKGATQQFTATAIFGDGSAQNITASATWGSSNTKVASVSNASGSNGLATTLSVGNATISATYGGANSVTTLTVTDAALSAIQVTPANPQLPVGFTRQLAATGIYSDGTKRDISSLVSWQAADSTVANISNAAGSQGIATGVKAASTSVSASLGAVSGATVLKVSGAAISSVQVTPFSTVIPVGTSLQFVATGTFSDHTTLDLTTQVNWQSSSTSTVAISNAAGSNGLATGVAQGVPASIKAQISGLTGTAAITVTAATLKSISISTAAGAATLPNGLTLQFTAVGSYSDSSTKDVTSAVTWQSSSPAVAAISNAIKSNGVLTGIGLGTSNISASIGSITSNSMNVTVTAAVLQTITFTPAASPTIPVGLPKKILATGTYSDATQRDVTNEVIWQSSDTSVALISNAGLDSGLVAPLKQGTATITATDGAISQQIALSVTGATLTSITLVPANVSITQGASRQFTATGTYSDSTTQDVSALVTWTSGDASIADVGNDRAMHGLVFAKSSGAVTIAAVDPLSGVSGTTQLTVNSP